MTTGDLMVWGREDKRSDKGDKDGGGSGGQNNGQNNGGNSNNSNNGDNNNNGGDNNNTSNSLTSQFPLVESDVASLFLSPGFKAVMVNDMAPIVKYSPGWNFTFAQQKGKPPPGHTFHSTSMKGSQAFLSFQGTQIYVFGLLPPGSETISANYSIDGSPAQVGTMDASSLTDSYIGNATLFVSKSLHYGNHNLSILVTETGLGGRNFTLDYFMVIQPPHGNDNSQQMSSKGSSPEQGGNKHVGAIVGGVLGAFAVLLLVGLFLFFRRRRGQHQTWRGQPQMIYHGQPQASVEEPQNVYPYPFAPTWDGSTTSQSRGSWPVHDGTSRSSRFLPPTIAASPAGSGKFYERPGSIRSMGSWTREVGRDSHRGLSPIDVRRSSGSPGRSGSSTARNSSMDAEVSHFSLYSSQKSVSTMKFREPTPPPVPPHDRPRVPQTLQPLEPVPQGDFDRFTTASGSVRDYGRAL